MKKIFLIIVMTVIVAITWAQQPSIIRGKTKENKMLSVQYYPGSLEDRIESVKYQVVDELQGNIKTLQNNIKDLQNRLDAANKQIKQLNNDLTKSTNKNKIDSTFAQQIEAKETEITQLTAQIHNLDSLLQKADAEKRLMQAQLDSIAKAETQEQIQVHKENHEQKTEKLVSKSSLVIGLEAGIGPTVINTAMEAPWAKTTTWNKQLAVYFGTARFTESFPLSFEVGVGVNQLPISASIYQYSTQIPEWEDNDGDLCIAHYSFDNLSERLTMTSIGVPVRFCFGQPIKGKTSVYAKLGVTPALLLDTKFSREGSYTLKGEYPQWNVILEDIQELGYHTNAEFDGTPTKIKASNMFNLWGNLALGAYVPIGASVLLNMGLKLDYPIIGATSFDATDGSQLDIQGWDGLLNVAQKPLTASFEVGIVYSLK